MATGETIAQSSASQDILKQLAESNLFLVPLDHEGLWFRYHHLFQVLLFHKLRTENSTEQLASFHGEAGASLGENGMSKHLWITYWLRTIPRQRWRW